MHARTWTATAFALLAAVATSTPRTTQSDDVRALDGEWVYVQDVTEGRAVEKQGPPMSPRLRLRVDEDALVWLRSGGHEERMPLDGETREVPEGDKVKLLTSTWRDGMVEVLSETVSAADGSSLGLLRRAFEVVPEGMVVHVSLEPGDYSVKALYRHPEDIPLPTPAEATIDDVAWLAGAWVGERGTSTVEERWTPPSGGALLGVSRTVKNGRMTGFEYLRVVERDGGLVYVAQPGGKPPTEFVLTDLIGTLAVFENPRHDSPQRIAYELHDDGSLSASIGYCVGGSPQRFEFAREGE